MKEKKNIKKNSQTKKNLPKIEKVVENKLGRGQLITSKNKMSNNELKNLILVVIAVLAIFVVFYFITVYVTKNKKAETVTNNAAIQYEEILVGTLLTQKDEHYYVLTYKNDDNYIDSYKSYIETYSATAGATKFYNANLYNAFNKKYYTENETSATDVSNLTDLKLKDTTLFEIKSGEIVKVYEGKDSILEFLKTLV